MAYFAAVSTSDAVYIIGGYATYVAGGEPPHYIRPEGDPVYTPNIAKYENGAWSMAGNLQAGREIHSALLIGEEIYVNGGSPAAP